MGKEKVIKTPYQQRKEELDMKVYEERQRLLQVDGAMATAVDKHLMEKYNIYGKSTIWQMCKRAERRLRKS